MNSKKKPIRTKHQMDTQISSDDHRQRQRQRIVHVKSEQNLLLQRTTIDESKIQQQLMKQIQEVKDIIVKYANQLDNKSAVSLSSQSWKGSGSSGLAMDQLIKMIEELQTSIQSKNHDISVINQEIKALKTSPGQSYRDANYKYKAGKQSLFYRLSDQISQQKQQLVNLQKEHKRKKKELQDNIKLMKQTYEAYSNMVVNGSKKIISYQEFLGRKKEKKIETKTEMNSKSKKVSRRHLATMRQSHESQDDKNIMNSTNLTDAENKKKIAESALRILKRKHQAEMDEMNSKKQFLQDENRILDGALVKILAQLSTAEKKFSQTRQNTVSAKQLQKPRYSQPEN